MIKLKYNPHTTHLEMKFTDELRKSFRGENGIYDESGFNTVWKDNKKVKELFQKWLNDKRNLRIQQELNN